MKKYLFFAAALIAMGCGMSSCSNEAEVTEKTEQAPKLTKLVFTVAQDAQTRASWDGKTPVFDDGDEVSLFSENNDNVKLTAYVDGAGNVTLEGEGTSGDTDLYFVYPYYEERVSFFEGEINGDDVEYSSPYNFENEIYPSVNKYPSKALSLAKSTDGGANAIRFQGLTTIIKFTPATDCRGSIHIDAGDDLIPLCHAIISTAETKIVAGSGLLTQLRDLPYDDAGYNFAAGNSYYFALPPFSMAEGGTISFVDDQYEETTLYTAPAGGKEFVAGKIYNLKYGSTGGEVVFDKDNSNVSWTGSGSSTLTGADSQSGVTLTLTRSSGNITRTARTGNITFSSAQAGQTLTISVTGKKATSLTNSATSKTLEGEGPWELTYKTTPEVTTNGWYTNGGAGVVFILASTIAGTDKLTVVYE